MMKISLAFLFLLPFFTACSTSQETACTASDWYEFGRRDGAQGVPTEEFTKRLNRCSPEAQASAKKLYDNGYNAGLVDYCSPENGFYLGASNQKYYYVCPPSLEEAFLAQYKKGQQAYNLQQENEQIEEQMDSLFRSLNQESLSKAQRNLIRAELTELKKARAQIERRLARIQQ